MPTEKRLITFSEHEVRNALLMLPAAARDAAWDETSAMSLGQGAAVIIKLVDGSDFEMTQDKVGAALLLYCKAENIPVPKQGMKSLRSDEKGITLIIDVADALLSTPWETYELPSDRGGDRNPAAKCPKCGTAIPKR